MVWSLMRISANLAKLDVQVLMETRNLPLLKGEGGCLVVGEQGLVVGEQGLVVGERVLVVAEISWLTRVVGLIMLVGQEIELVMIFTLQFMQINNVFLHMW